MRGRIVPLVVLGLLLLMPLCASGSDAITGLVGEGSNDDMSVQYMETDDSCILVVNFTQMPSVRNIGIIVTDSMGHSQNIPIVPTAKTVAVFLTELSIGLYDVIVYDSQTGMPIEGLDCVMNVHSQTQVTYILQFDGNGAEGIIAPILVTSGSAVLPSCTFTAPDGKTFQSWKVDGTEYQPGATVSITKDTVAYAQWSSSGGSGDTTMLVVIAIIAIVAALIVAVIVLRRKV